MNPTANPQIHALLHELFLCIQKVFGDKFLGLYLYGSLVAGDFDRVISDIDLLAVVSEPVTDPELVSLKKLHDDIANNYPSWRDRVEVQYVSAAALQTFKTQKSTIVTISPGEPMHFIKAGRDWLINWFDVQEHGKVLFGPNPATFIPTISKEEYKASMREQAPCLHEWIRGYDSKSARGPCAYVVLTLCRIFYGVVHGEQVSKPKAASWVSNEFPQWAELIREATAWRDAQWDKKQEPIGQNLERVFEFGKFVTDTIS